MICEWFYISMKFDLSVVTVIFQIQLQIYEKDAHELFPKILAMSQSLPPVIEVVKMNSKKAKFLYEVKLKDWDIARSKIPVLKVIQVYIRGSCANIPISFGQEIRAMFDVYNSADCEKFVYLHIQCNKALSDVKTVRRILRFIGFTGVFHYRISI